MIHLLLGQTAALLAVAVALSGAISNMAYADAYDAEPSVDGLQPRAHILSEKVICRQEQRYIGWPAMICTRDGELVVVFSGDRDWHVCPWGKVQMVRSRDGGRTWSSTSLVIDTPLDDRNTSILQLPNGDLYTIFHASLAFATRTGPRYDPYKDHAATISAAVRKRFDGFWAVNSKDGGVTWGELVSVPASTPHGPALLDDGRLLIIGSGQVYDSMDNGRTWEQCATIVKNPDTWKSRYAFLSETTVVQAGEGRIVALSRYRDGDDIELRQTVSTDGGKTWSELSPTGMRGYPAQLLRLDNGWLLASYGRRIAPMGQRACISKDNGRTWLVDEEIILSNAVPQQSGDLGYPASAQLPDDTIWTVYYQVEKPEHGEYPSLMATHWRLRGE